MKKLLQLENYYMTRLHIDYDETVSPPHESRDNPAFDFEVFENPDDDHLLALEMSFGYQGQEGKNEPPWAIDARILGVFRFESEVKKEEIGPPLFLNGSTILYGILRGILASVGGNFPVGRIILPTVYMEDILKEWSGRISEKPAKPASQTPARRRSLRSRKRNPPTSNS